MKRIKNNNHITLSDVIAIIVKDSKNDFKSYKDYQQEEISSVKVDSDMNRGPKCVRTNKITIE